MEATVTKIMRHVYEENGKWYTTVQYTNPEHIRGIRRLAFDTQAEAEAVQPDYIFTLT